MSSPSAVLNTQFGPPPLATPLLNQTADQAGVPFQHRSDNSPELASLLVSTGWGQWFNQIGVQLDSLVGFIADTWANIGNYPAAQYRGYLYFVTDRTVTYRSDGTNWLYYFGTMNDSYPNIPTLGANDIGFEFWDQTHGRLFVWKATGGAPAVTSPGWDRGPSELPTAAMQVLPLGPASTNIWSLCNGGAVSITQDDASTTTVTKPNMIGAYPIGTTVGSYTGAQVAAVAPTVSGLTGVASTGITFGAVDVDVTVPTQAVFSSESDPGHLHSISLTAALPGDPVTHLAVPWYMKR